MFKNYCFISNIKYLIVLQFTSETDPDLSDLRNHPLIKDVTPHKKVTRTLKVMDGIMPLVLMDLNLIFASVFV